jgi:hypothetical protein
MEFIVMIQCNEKEMNMLITMPGTCMEAANTCCLLFLAGLIFLFKVLVSNMAIHSA